MGCDCGSGLQAVGESVDALHNLLLRYLSQHAAPAEQYESRFTVPNVTTAPASGTVAVDLGSPVNGKVWYVEWISKHASTGTVTLGVFVGPKLNTDAAYRRDFSLASQDDIANENPPIYVGSGEYLTLQWAAATVGATLSASLQICVHRIGSPFLA